MTRWHYAENLALKVEIVFFCESISLGGKNQNGLRKGWIQTCSPFFFKDRRRFKVRDFGGETCLSLKIFVRGLKNSKFVKLGLEPTLYRVVFFGKLHTPSRCRKVQISFFFGLHLLRLDWLFTYVTTFLAFQPKILLCQESFNVFDKWNVEMHGVWF